MKKSHLTIRVDLTSDTPAYRQIVDSLRMHLVNGDLAPGEVLPSVRRMAMELGITFNTVAQAYRQLAEEGWLDVKHGRSAIVVDRGVPPRTTRGRISGFRTRIHEMAAQMRADGWSPADIAAELRTIAERLEA